MKAAQRKTALTAHAPISENAHRGYQLLLASLPRTRTALTTRRRWRNRVSVRRGASGRVLYNYFRDYDPAVSRYVEADPIGLDGGVNLYAYANSSPIDTEDPAGELGVIGALFGGGLDLAYQTLIEGKSLKCVNWAQVGGAAALGAIGGAGIGGAFKLSKGSMKTANALRRYRRGNDIPRTHDVHHWGIERSSSLGRRLPDGVVNHPANLNPIPRALHQDLHNRFGPVQRWWHGTPDWAKAAEISALSGGAAEQIDSECGCEK